MKERVRKRERNACWRSTSGDNNDMLVFSCILSSNPRFASALQINWHANFCEMHKKSCTFSHLLKRWDLMTECNRKGEIKEWHETIKISTNKTIRMVRQRCKRSRDKRKRACESPNQEMKHDWPILCLDIPSHWLFDLSREFHLQLVKASGSFSFLCPFLSSLYLGGLTLYWPECCIHCFLFDCSARLMLSPRVEFRWPTACLFWFLRRCSAFHSEFQFDKHMLMWFRISLSPFNSGCNFTSLARWHYFSAKFSFKSNSLLRIFVQAVRYFQLAVYRPQV